jgi:hypothetical protein
MSSYTVLILYSPTMQGAQCCECQNCTRCVRHYPCIQAVLESAWQIDTGCCRLNATIDHDDVVVECDSTFVVHEVPTASQLARPLAVSFLLRFTDIRRETRKYEKRKKKRPIDCGIHFNMDTLQHVKHASSRVNGLTMHTEICLLVFAWIGIDTLTRDI